MKQRCNNPNNPKYPSYGGRGIKICEEWANDFEEFKSWSYENGYSDELSIDRVDNDGNYEPSNCKWSSPKEQCNNRRNSRKIAQYVHADSVIKVWESATECNAETGIDISSILKCCKGKRKTAGGYCWKFI